MKKFFYGLAFASLFIGASAIYVNQTKAEQIQVASKYKKLGIIDGYTVYKNTEYKYFAQALDYFYEDDTYRYYFPDMRTHIYMVTNEEETLGIKEALNEKKISIDNLRKVIPNIHREKKS